MTNTLKITDTENYACSGYGITFDSAGLWSFCNELPKNVIIFGVDNGSSSHSDNC